MNGGMAANNVSVTSCVSIAVAVWKCAGGLSWRTALSPLSFLVKRPVISEDNVCLILQFPFFHEKVVHGSRHEKMCIRDTTKFCLKPVVVSV
jgi:hypothetical protein